MKEIILSSSSNDEVIIARGLGLRLYASVEDIERLQKRALRCIVGDVTYEEARSMFELSTLVTVGKNWCDVSSISCCLAYLMPAKRELSLINYLQDYTTRNYIWTSENSNDSIRKVLNTLLYTEFYLKHWTLLISIIHYPLAFGCNIKIFNVYVT